MFVLGEQKKREPDTISDSPFWVMFKSVSEMNQIFIPQKFLLLAP